MGYVVPYGDVNALADTMRRIIANPGEAEAKGAAGRRMFETEFNWERMEDRLDAAFARARIILPAAAASKAGRIFTQTH
jgi:glycosyltransferase involved in cell wall biosynthesis